MATETEMREMQAEAGGDIRIVGSTLEIKALADVFDRAERSKQTLGAIQNLTAVGWYDNAIRISRRYYERSGF